MLDLMMGHREDSGHCQREQQNTCSKPKTEFFELFNDLSASVIKSH